MLVKQLRRSFSDGLPTFVTGGIGSTPDDHTRQAAAAALDLPVVRHPEAAKFIEGVTQKRGEPLDSPEHAQRLKMADFPEGAELVPNPFNHEAQAELLESLEVFPSTLPTKRDHVYNKSRQAAITTELSEIVAGAAAV